MWSDVQLVQIEGHLMLCPDNPPPRSRRRPGSGQLTTAIRSRLAVRRRRSGRARAQWEVRVRSRPEGALATAHGEQIREWAPTEANVCRAGGKSGHHVRQNCVGRRASKDVPFPTGRTRRVFLRIRRIIESGPHHDCRSGSWTQWYQGEHKRGEHVHRKNSGMLPMSPGRDRSSPPA